MIFPCSDCGKHISTKAESCPNCGSPVEIESALQKAGYACKYCEGKGSWQIPCRECGGRLDYACEDCVPIRSPYFDNPESCTTCHGTGRAECWHCSAGKMIDSCSYCHATGLLTVHQEEVIKATEIEVNRKNEELAATKKAQEEEAKRKADADQLQRIADEKARRHLEEQAEIKDRHEKEERFRLQSEYRLRNGLCIVCGNKLGLYEKFRKQTVHSPCDRWRT